MVNYIKREHYLQQLILRRDNGEVKVITGPRRSGKSWLLSHVYYDYLIEQGVKKENIIHISFDMEDETEQDYLKNHDALKAYLYGQIQSANEHYYIMLDEIQEIEGFERLVNGLNNRENVDVYITGSNSHFLSSDINTLFRGRGDEVHVFPLTFREFIDGREEPINVLWKEYCTYGGMPGLRNHHTPQQKTAYLQRLWRKTYIADIVERHNVKNTAALESLADVLCSAIGSLSNASKLSNTIMSVMQTKVDSETVSRYIGYLEDAFLIEGAKRYDIKGKRYFESIRKYYCSDVGLRNARLNFRQQEITHIMENIIYNELRARGNMVDIGVVQAREKREGKMQVVQYEVDFIVNDGMNKYYIQSAYRIDDEAKRDQELQSLRRIDDSFRKIVIVGDDIAAYTDELGITYVGLMDFLLGDSLTPQHID